MEQMFGSDLSGMFQTLFLLTVFTDATSAILSYLIVSKTIEEVAEQKVVVSFVSWTVLFYGFTIVISMFVYLINAGAVLSFPSLSIQVMQIVFLLFPFNLVFIGTWIFGGLLVSYMPPKGYD